MAEVGKAQDREGQAQADGAQRHHRADHQAVGQDLQHQCASAGRPACRPRYSSAMRASRCSSALGATMRSWPSTSTATAVGHGQRGLDVLLDQQHGDAAVAHLAQLVQHLAHQLGAQAGRRFVEHQHARLRDQRTRHRQHLPLPARQPARQQRALARQVGEGGIDRRQTLLPRLAAGQQQRGGEFQVLGDRQVGEHVLGLRHEGQAAVHQAVGRHVGDVLAAEQHTAAAHRHQAGHGLDQRGLAGAVGADDGDDLAGLHRQRGAAHDRQAGLVTRFEVFAHRAGHGHCALMPHPPDRPRPRAGRAAPRRARR